MWRLGSCDLSVVKQRSGFRPADYNPFHQPNHAAEKKRVKFTKAMSLAHPKNKIFSYYSLEILSNVVQTLHAQGVIMYIFFIKKTKVL
jgi:hypothetical protein